MAGDIGLPYVPFVMADGTAIAKESEKIITVPSRYGVDTDVDLGEPGTPMFLGVSTLGVTEGQVVNTVSEIPKVSQFFFKLPAFGPIQFGRVSEDMKKLKRSINRFFEQASPLLDSCFS